MNETNKQLLVDKAKYAASLAHAPYSKFKVGVALMDENGEIFSGCNVENMAFPVGLCAEQVAISKAVSEVGPSLKIKHLVVYTSTDEPTSPCGSCRQFMNEFSRPDMEFLSVCDSDKSIETNFEILFPYPLKIEFEE